jgi:hypothetical protein
VVFDTRQYIKNNLYDVISAVVSDAGRVDPVIYDNENGPRPVAPFVSIEFTGGGTPGQPNYRKVDPDTGEQHIVQFQRKTLTMYGFGEGSFALLEYIRDCFFKNSWIDMLKQRNLVIPQVMDVIESGADMDGVKENQASFDFDITFLRVFNDTPGWIENAIITPEGLPMGEIISQEE